MEDCFEIVPIGLVKKTETATWLEVFEKYQKGLLRLEEFSHVITLWWISGRDSKKDRQKLRVRPRVKLGPKQHKVDTPLCGVFATRAPIRPNPIGLTIAKISHIEKNRVFIDRHDAFNDTPLIDLKPYIPKSDSIENVRLPAFFRGLAEKRER
ncbi:MAG: tRNA (N6-threonylcarbamoyladenosine(37)-N6)-methyltransferase TrmO [Candidatus Heimdallarchaeota archaeon]|nr:tRNA (N6-threonylcarbamoyladenosine(37)-N6)-methyltransferase TrmO [Candidatus Heimdallarchaeota archaeon]